MIHKIIKELSTTQDTDGTIAVMRQSDLNRIDANALSDALVAFADSRSLPNLLDLFTVHLHRLVNMDWCGWCISSTQDPNAGELLVLFEHGVVSPPAKTTFTCSKNIPAFAEFLSDVTKTIVHFQGAVCEAQPTPCVQSIIIKISIRDSVNALIVFSRESEPFNEYAIMAAYNLALAFGVQFNKLSPCRAEDFCSAKAKLTETLQQTSITTNLLKSLVEGTGAKIGDDFFKSVVTHLSQALSISYAFIGKLNKKRDQISTIAVWQHDSLAENFSYNIVSDAGCQGRLCYCGESVVKLMPDIEFQNKLQVKSCWALPLNDSSDTTVGVLVVMHDQPLARDQEIIPIMKIFASRASAELERLNTEQRLYNDGQRAQVTLESIGDGVVTTDSDGKIVFLNPAAEIITGWKTQDAKGLILQDIIKLRLESTGVENSHYVSDSIHNKTKTVFREDHILTNKYGREVPVSGILSPMFDSEGKVSGLVMAIHDASDVRSAINVLTYQARHDALTGLLNRTAFEMVLNDAIVASKNEHVKHALLFIDLDHFKRVNDSAGHIAGDELLKRVAAELRVHTRIADRLARIGGDEFAILLAHCPIPDAEKIANEIREHIQNIKFGWQGVSYDISASIGVTQFSPEVGDLSMILSIADSACYIAKGKGKNHVHIDNPEGDNEHPYNSQQIIWLKRIKDALTNNKFILYHQEIRAIDINDKKGKKFELLVRMLEDDGTLIPPMAFIPAAERYDLMFDIDKWVVSQAFKMIARLPVDSTYSNSIFSINLSGNTLCKAQFFEFVVEQFDIHGIPPPCICFEITETAAV
ncbi:MAG: diguanylate cyclase, partial [Gammaproteobacteria bacterium]|nr:diguanylate cyclase [Gammaproteobacteria bacterium]